MYKSSNNLLIKNDILNFSIFLFFNTKKKQSTTIYSFGAIFNGGGDERFNWFSRSIATEDSSRNLKPLHRRPVNGSLIFPSS